MDIESALDAAVDEFGRRLLAVSADAWTLPTPCPEWDVRYLAAHVIGGNRFAAMVLGGISATDAIARVMSTPQLRDDPIRAWATSCAVQREAFQATESARPVDHPLGAITASDLLAFRVFDITVHAWDLARSLDLDAQLDPDLVDVVLDIIDHGPPRMGFGIIALGATDPAASPKGRLLDLTGRIP